MKQIIYYVATSLDGFISGPEGDVSKFVPSGAGVEKYLADLQQYKTVIMGRKTYEFGYNYGLEPGQPAYAHMEHYIFSNTLVLPSRAANVHVEKVSIQRVKAIVKEAATDVYLCGGGQFAGWLLDHNLIDELILKLNPIILGDGVRLFGESTSSISGELIKRESFEGGLEILNYRLKK